MASDLNIQSINISYHRNGVSGEGFFAVHFTADVDESKNEKLIAVVVPGEECSTDEYKCNGNCFVVRPTRPDLAYRGDKFEPDMRLILKAHKIKWRKEFDRSLQEKKLFTGEVLFRDMDDVTETLIPFPEPKANQRFTGII